MSSNLAELLEDFRTNRTDIQLSIAQSEGKLRRLEGMASKETKRTLKKLRITISDCKVTVDNEEEIRSIYVGMMKALEEVKDHQKEHPPAQLGRSDRRVEIVFTSTYREKRLRVYQVAFQSEEVEVSPYDGSVSRTMQWRTKPILEIVDRSGAAIWKFPNVSALNDLLYSVQYQVAGAKELLDEFMKEWRRRFFQP